jgi:uncharacterized membrane protein
VSGPGGRNRDLLLVAAATLVSLLLVALPLDGAVLALLLFPAVLVLPGYALVAAMFPAPSLSRGERLAYAFAASVGAAALGGLAWQLFFDLGPFVWASILTAITLAACEVARRRRAGLKDAAKRRRLPRLDAPTAIAAILAVGFAAIAVRSATAGEEEQRAESHFSALWIVPKGGTGNVEVGVVNHQGAVHAYRLLVTADGRRLRDRERRLGSRARVSVLLAAAEIPPGARLIATLYRDGAVYRRAELQSRAGA